MQQFDQDILVNEVVQIRNTKTGSYLTATGLNTQEKGFLFSSIVQLKKFTIVLPTKIIITWLGVMIRTTILHFGLQLNYLMIQTKQIMVILFFLRIQVLKSVKLNKEIQIHLQQGDQIFQTKQYSIQSGVHLRIQTTKLTNFLSTSNKNYTSKQVKQYKEISCGKDSDYNNWEIVKLNPQKQQFFEIQPTLKLKINIKEIFDSDKVIIKNYRSGYSLHSHKNKYASTGMQEITCYSYERDVNDWWVIQQTFQMAQKQIQDQMAINLVHQETIKFLNVDEINLAKSKNGNQVRGMQSSMQQSFIISTIDNQSLIVGKPFFLFYQPINKYLSQGPSLSEMQQTQYEVIMTDKLTTSCLWVIEKKIQ